eukprot:755749-Hanusia_phi.AAC.5
MSAQLLPSDGSEALQLMAVQKIRAEVRKEEAADAAALSYARRTVSRPVTGSSRHVDSSKFASTTRTGLSAPAPAPAPAQPPPIQEHRISHLGLTITNMIRAPSLLNFESRNQTGSALLLLALLLT